MSDDPTITKIRARVAGLLELERAIRAYIAVLEAAQQTDLERIPMDLRARISARASAIADLRAMIERPHSA